MRRPSDRVRLRVWGMVYLMIVATVPGAHAEHYYFHLYTATDGLPRAVVQSMYQDRSARRIIGARPGLHTRPGQSRPIHRLLCLSSPAVHERLRPWSAAFACSRGSVLSVQA